LKLVDLKKNLNLANSRKLFFGGVLLVIAFFIFLISPPRNLNGETIIHINKGESIKSAAAELKDSGVIRSTAMFNFLITFYGQKIVEGEYYFNRPPNLLSVLFRVTRGIYGFELKNITFFEGMTVAEMAQRLGASFPGFDTARFVEIAKPQEGYLFPDTYRFQINASPESVLEEMRENFAQKITENQQIIENSKYSLSQIIIMASIVEKEATSDTKEEVASILWKRFEEDFPLQVDAPFVYFLNKGTFDLTLEDLQTDNPYNTYQNAGLIPTPIGNPGLEAILASANPKPTENFYFLTGRDGEMYFAKTFEEHKRNRLLYLD